LVGGLVVVMTACSATSPASDGPTTRTGVLDQAVRELVEMPGGPPGAIVVVQRGSDRSIHTAGVAQVGSGAPPSVNDHLRIASGSKAFNGATALALVSDGVLSLDDTIGTRLPDLPEAWGKVALRQLLDHTSGLPDFTTADGWVKAATTSPGLSPAPAEVVRLVEAEPLAFSPGSRYAYSNSDNVVVSPMIEAVTGRRYVDVLADTVFGPLGLKDTSLPTGTEIPDPVMHGYGVGADGKPVDQSSVLAAGFTEASGGMVSTPADLNAFVRGYVSGTLFDEKVRTQQHQKLTAGTSQQPWPGTNSAGMALFRYDTQCGTVYGHTGNIFDYTEFAVASPDGQRSATTSVSSQLNAGSTGQATTVYAARQDVVQTAICSALE
jgi:D-alanyl-D-alanine carboxypeptidase